MSGSVGRPSNRIDGFGPAAEFARELRATWESAGSPKLKSMARCGRSSGSLSEATKGHRVPTAETTEAFLKGCGVVGEAELAVWARRRQEAETAAKRFAAELDRCDSLPDLRAWLCGLMTDQGLSIETLSERLSRMPGPAMSCEKVAEQLHGPGPLDQETLAALVIALGGTPSDAERCRGFRERVIEAPEPAGSTESRLTGGSPAVSRSYKTAGVAMAIARRGVYLCGGRSAAVVFSVATLVLLSAGLIAFDPRRGEGRLMVIAPKRDSPSAPQPESVAVHTAAAAKLADLSRRVGQRREQPVAGRYTYNHRRVWWTNTTEKPIGTDEEPEDVRLWWAADGSGRIVTSTTEGQGSSRSPDEQWFVVGELRIPIPEPSQDPQLLGAQLAVEQDPELGAAGRLRAVATLNNFHDLTAAQRACVLRLLADTPGVTYRGPYLDRADRAGLAFSADSREGTSVIRDTLVFDESTGILLAHEATTIPDNDTATPRVISHIVYLERARTSSATD